MRTVRKNSRHTREYSRVTVDWLCHVNDNGDTMEDMNDRDDRDPSKMTEISMETP